MKRFAFTLLELVFVIIVIGILAVLAMPSFNSNLLQQGAIQVAEHIRYTQHLAMVDDKFDPNDPIWYRKRWQIRFRQNSGSSAYVIFSDSVTTEGNANNAEMAIDPLSGKRIDGISLFAPSEKFKNANLTESYEIKGNDGILQSCFNNDGSLVTSNKGVFAFDHLGRPYSGISNAASPYDRLMTTDCNVTLTNKQNESVVIKVSAETGYVCIFDNDTGICR